MGLRLPALCAACAALTVALLGCGHSSGSHASVRVVQVTERDFAIRAPKVLRAGDALFVIRNRGPISHELILVHAPLGRLPMRSDGLTIDEEALESSTVGVLEAGGPGTRHELRVRLSPGRYILFCNMAGHYMSGMSTSLRVV